MQLQKELRQKQTMEISEIHSMCQSAEARAKTIVKNHNNGESMFTALSKINDSIFKKEIRWNIDWILKMTN